MEMPYHDLQYGGRGNGRFVLILSHPYGIQGHVGCLEGDIDLCFAQILERSVPAQGALVYSDRDRSGDVEPVLHAPAVGRLSEKRHSIIPDHIDLLPSLQGR